MADRLSAVVLGIVTAILTASDLRFLGSGMVYDLVGEGLRDA